MKTKRKGKEKNRLYDTQNRTQDLPHARPFRCYYAT